MATKVHFDGLGFLRLRRIGGEKLVGRVVDLFLETVPRRLEVAESGERSGDLEVVAGAAHSLHSSFQMLGAADLAGLARRIEQRARDGDRASIGGLLKELKDSVQGALKELRDRTEPRAMKKVAIVEDNEDSRLLVRAILRDAYEVIEYEDGRSALAGMRVEKPDLLLLDISLPGMEGGEVLRKIRSDELLSELPVIALTAHSMAGDREKYLAAGFNDHIGKPILDEGILFAAIERWSGGGAPSKNTGKITGARPVP
jgi:CheY-like chemotaxis protein